MTLYDLIQKQRKRLTKEHDEFDLYEILMFVLQLPSICSRIEFPQTDENTEGNSKCPSGTALYDKNNHPKDKALYFAWIDKHASDFGFFNYSYMDPQKTKETIYDLRNNITHTGFIPGSSKIFLCEEKAGSLVSSNIAFFSISSLCEAIFNAAENTIYPFDPEKNPEISPYKNLILPYSEFSRIISLYFGAAEKYWENRKEDLFLYNQYKQNEENVPENIPDKDQIKKMIREANTHFAKIDKEILETL